MPLDHKSSSYKNTYMQIVSCADNIYDEVETICESIDVIADMV